MFSHSHFHCEMVFVFPLGILPRLKPLSLSYMRIQISFPFSPEQIVAKGEVFLQVCSPHFTAFQNFQ